MGYYNYYINKNSKTFAYEFGAEFLKKEPVFMCVGSSNVVADCFGPLVGELLTNKYGVKRVFGNLSENITSTNLNIVYNKIKAKYPFNPIVVVDSAICEENNVGLIKLMSSGCVPAAGKNFEIMGDYSLLGLTNVTGIKGLMFLRTVKFEMVLKMANFLSESVSAGMDLIKKAAN